MRCCRKELYFSWIDFSVRCTRIAAKGSSQQSRWTTVCVIAGDEPCSNSKSSSSNSIRWLPQQQQQQQQRSYSSSPPSGFPILSEDSIQSCKTTSSSTSPSQSTTSTTTTSTITATTLKARKKRQIRSNANNNNNNDNTVASITDIIARSPNTKRVARGFWVDPKNHRLFFDKLAPELGIKSLDDWYDIRTSQVRKLGGCGLLNEYYDGSLPRALQAVYPEHAWDMCKFSKVPSKYWHDRSKHREFFDKLAVELGVKQLDDWYGVSGEQVKRRGGAALLKYYYGNSLMKALREIYPEHSWDMPRFNKVPKGFWNSWQNRRDFFDKIGRERFGIVELDDWYRVTADQVRTNGGSGLMRHSYNNSLVKALEDVYPEHPWQVSRFVKVPNGFWSDPNNHREFFDRLGREVFGVKHLDDWYSVTLEEVKPEAGGLLNHYGGSLIRALQAIYPEHPWDETKFSSLPRGYWSNVTNHRAFFDKLAAELGVKKLDDWYSVSVDEIRAKGGSTLIGSYYNGSLSQALAAVYPEHQWRKSQFSKVPRGHWQSLENHRAFFDHLAVELGVKQWPEDWYQVTVDDVAKRGGSGLLCFYYGDSLFRALQTIYPEHKWHSWRFQRISFDTSIDEDNLQEYIEALARELNIQHMDDWYRVSRSQIKQFGGEALLHRNGGLFLVLKRIYPQHPWDEKRFFTGVKKSMQRSLMLNIKKLFPDAEVLEDYLHPQLVFASSQQIMQLDLYVPSLSLAFEYQGEQHYRDLMMFGPHAKYEGNDSEKRRACREAGVTLVVIPYWWDRTAESLAEAIKEVRPELFADQVAQQ